MAYVEVKTADGCLIKVDYDVAKVSGKIKEILAKKELTDDQAKVTVSFDDISYYAMNQAFRWATCHKDDPPQPEIEILPKRSECIAPWDAEFLKHEDPEKLFSLMFAADKLDMPLLYDLVAKTMANIIKGKTTEEIRMAFGIENDLTPEQLQEIDNKICIVIKP